MDLSRLKVYHRRDMTLAKRLVFSYYIKGVFYVCVVYKREFVKRIFSFYFSGEMVLEY